MRRVVVAVAVLLGALILPAAPGAPNVPGMSASIAEAAPTDIIALVVEGTGFGHGRGMSQYGAYGYAVNHGWNVDQILNHYYGGTVMGDVDVNATTSVRLLALDNQEAVGLVSHGGGVTWNGLTFASMRAVRAPSGYYDIYASSVHTCAADVWIGNTVGVPGATFTTQNGDAPWMAADQALGVCQPNASVIHYRGAIDVLTVDGGRVVNRLRAEDYLRGVVPREVPASWAGPTAAGPDGPGRNALQAQAVAARSYAAIQNRYSFAKTCDTTACQAYGGAAARAAAASAPTIREDGRSDRAIAATAGKVRRWPGSGAIVSTEYSSSNGPRTAGGDFPPVDDAGDSTYNNPNHRWTRVADADAVAARFGTGELRSVSMIEGDPRYDGIWWNTVRLVGASRTVDVGAWDFMLWHRQQYGVPPGGTGLPSPGFTVSVVTRDTTDRTFGFIGDSVGNSIAGAPTSEFPMLIDGTFPSATLNVRDGRCIAHACAAGADPASNGAYVASTLPANLDLVVVQLGYNQVSSAGFAADVDTMMNALTARGVRQVAWVNLGTAPGTAQSATYAQRNVALLAATARWPNLTILDWDSTSRHVEWPRWYSDHAHLTATGQARFAVWLRDQVSQLAPSSPFRTKVTPGRVLSFRIAGVDGVPGHASAVALNVTAVDPAGWGYLTVWPCGSPMPEASNVNFTSAGAVEPNSVLAKVDSTGKICVYTYATTHVIVDVAGWFSGGFESISPVRTVDTRNGIGVPRARLSPGAPLRVRVAGVAGVPANATAVAMNVTAVGTAGWGYLTVWPCGAPMPNASNVNFVSAGAVEPNSVLAKVDGTGEVCIATSSPTDVLVDVAGWFTSGYESISPERTVDTRNAIGAPLAKVTPAAPLRVRVTGAAGVPAHATAVAMNVTAVDPAGWGYLTVWPCGAAMPNASNVNFVSAGAVEPNSVLAKVDGTGEVCIATSSPTHVLVDVAGWFTSGYESMTPIRTVDTRNGIGTS